MGNMTRDQASQQAAFSTLLAKLNGANVEIANMAAQVAGLEHDVATLTAKLNTPVVGKSGE